MVRLWGGEVETMITRVLREGVAPLLAPLGFDYSPGYLRKLGADYCWVVEMQPEGEQRFGVGLGVHYPSLMAEVLSDPAQAYLQSKCEPPMWEICAHQTTLAQLARRKNFRWTVAANTDLKRVIEEVTVLLLEAGLPWLGQRKDWRSVLTDSQARYRQWADLDR